MYIISQNKYTLDHCYHNIVGSARRVRKNTVKYGVIIIYGELSETQDIGSGPPDISKGDVSTRTNATSARNARHRQDFRNGDVSTRMNATCSMEHQTSVMATR